MRRRIRTHAATEHRRELEFEDEVDEDGGLYVGGVVVEWLANGKLRITIARIDESRMGPVEVVIS